VFDLVHGNGQGGRGDSSRSVKVEIARYQPHHYLFTGIFFQLMMMAIDISTDGSCSYNTFITKLNLYYQFLASMQEVVVYIQTYANNQAGLDLQTHFTTVKNSLVELQGYVLQASNQSSVDYWTPNLPVWGRPLPASITTYTQNIVTVLNTLTTTWTSIQTIVTKYVPSGECTP